MCVCVCGGREHGGEREKGEREEEEEANVQLHLRVKFRSCHLIYDVCTVAAVSFVKGCNTVSAIENYSRHALDGVSNVALSWVSSLAQVLAYVFFSWCDGRVDSRLVTTSDTSSSCSSVSVPHGGVVGFKDVSSWSASFGTAFGVEASAKEAVVAHVSFLCLQC